MNLDLDLGRLMLGGACALGLLAAPAAFAQGASSPATSPGEVAPAPPSAGPTSSSSASLGAATGPARGAAGSASGGSGGSAAAGGTSASTLGVGGTSTSPDQSSTSLGVGGSAASANGGHVMSRSGVHGRRNLNGQAMAQAHDRGTFSKSHTHCRAGSVPGVACRTKTMSHVPGSKPAMSTTTSTTAPR